MRALTFVIGISVRRDSSWVLIFRDSKSILWQEPQASIPFTEIRTLFYSLPKQITGSVYPFRSFEHTKACGLMMTIIDIPVIASLAYHNDHDQNFPPFKMDATPEGIWRMCRDSTFDNSMQPTLRPKNPRSMLTGHIQSAKKEQVVPPISVFNKHASTKFSTSDRSGHTLSTFSKYQTENKNSLCRRGLLSSTAASIGTALMASLSS